MEVSVIIPSYNSTKTLEGVVASLNRQETHVKFEVVIIDSSPHAPRVPPSDVPLRLIHLPTQFYPGGARNLGAQVATSSQLLFLDSDCIADTGWVEAHHRCLEAGKQIVTGPVLAATPCNLIALGENLVHMTDHCVSRSPGPIRYALGCNCAIDRLTFERIGGFCDTVLAGEDLILCEHLGRFHIQPWFEPAARVKHIHRDCLRDLLRHQLAMGAWVNRTRVWYHLRGYGVARWRILQALLPAYRLAKIMRSAIRLRSIDPILALPIILLGLGARTLGELFPEWFMNVPQHTSRNVGPAPIHVQTNTPEATGAGDRDRQAKDDLNRKQEV